MSLERGLVVKSLKGRDAGRLLAVISVKPNCVEVCDGKERKLHKPKSKNLKHIEPTAHKLSEEDLAYDGRLRKALNRLDNSVSL